MMGDFLAVLFNVAVILGTEDGPYEPSAPATVEMPVTPKGVTSSGTAAEVSMDCNYPDLTRFESHQVIKLCSMEAPENVTILKKKRFELSKSPKEQLDGFFSKLKEFHGALSFDQSENFPDADNCINILSAPALVKLSNENGSTLSVVGSCLKSFSFPNLRSIEGKVKIRGNPQLDEKAVKHIGSLVADESSLDLQEIKECVYKAHKDRNCAAFYGDLLMEGPMSQSSEPLFITGCVQFRRVTNLRNEFFRRLNNSGTDCHDRNKNMVYETCLKDGPIKKLKEFWKFAPANFEPVTSKCKFDCLASELDAGQKLCRTVHGNVTINSATDKDLFYGVHEIEGRLTVDGFAGESLEFLMVLRQIRGEKPPLLVIQNCNNLKRLELLTLKDIDTTGGTTGGNPLMIVRDNPAYLMPLNEYDEWKSITKDRLKVDNKAAKEEPSQFWQSWQGYLVISGICLGGLGCVVAMIVVLCLHYKKKRDKKFNRQKRKARKIKKADLFEYDTSWADGGAPSAPPTPGGSTRMLSPVTKSRPETPLDG